MKNRILVSVLALLATATQVSVTLITLYGTGATVQPLHMVAAGRQTHSQA